MSKRVGRIKRFEEVSEAENLKGFLSKCATRSEQYEYLENLDGSRRLLDDLRVG